MNKMVDNNATGWRKFRNELARWWRVRKRHMKTKMRL